VEEAQCQEQPCEDRKGRGGSSSSGTKDEVLDLSSGKKNEAIGGVVGHDISGGGSAKSSLARIIHDGNIQGLDDCIRSRGRAGGGILVWSIEFESFVGSFSGGKDGRNGGTEHGLGVEQAKIRRNGWEWRGECQQHWGR
jgi:hypothetical protein